MTLKRLISLIILVFTVCTSFGQFDKYSSFQEMAPLAVKYFQENNLDSAILVSEYAYKKFPEEGEDVIAFLGGLYTRSGQYEKATAIWKAGHEKGYCFGLNNPAYDEYYEENSDFKELAAIEFSWNEKSHLEHEVVLPTNYDRNRTYPVVFILHGNSSNIKWAKESWKSTVMSNEYISIFVQSYAFSNKNKAEYKWEFDDEKTLKELTNIYDNIMESFPVDKNNIVFSGMSAGGYLVLQLAFEELIPMTGLIVNCPVVPNNIEDKAIVQFVEKNKRIGIITGENDFAINDQKNLIGNINKHGGQKKITINKNMGHEYAEDFPNLLDEYLKWIIE